MGGRQRGRGIYKPVLIAMTCFIALCGVAVVALGATIRLLSGQYLFSIPHAANLSVFLLVLGSVLVSGSITGCTVAVKESACAVVMGHLFNTVGIGAQIALSAWIFATNHQIHSWYTANSCTACQTATSLVSVLLIASGLISLSAILAQLTSIIMTVKIRQLRKRVQLKYANGYTTYPTLPLGYVAAPMPVMPAADPRSAYVLQASQPQVYFTYGGRGKMRPQYNKPRHLHPHPHLRPHPYSYAQPYVNGFAYSTYDPRFSSRPSSRPSTPKLSLSGHSMP